MGRRLAPRRLRLTRRHFVGGLLASKGTCRVSELERMSLGYSGFSGMATVRLRTRSGAVAYSGQLLASSGGAGPLSGWAERISNVSNGATTGAPTERRKEVTMTTAPTEMTASKEAQRVSDVDLAREFGLPGLRPAARTQSTGLMRRGPLRTRAAPVGTQEQGGSDDVLQLAHSFGLPGLRERSS